MSVNDRVVAMESRKRHDELCRAISRDLPTFLSVGSNLIELRDLGVYKESHKTFEIFVREQFSLERQQAYRLMEAASVARNLSPIGDKIETPKLESQLREVAKAPPEKQAEVVKKAVAKAAEENREPVAKDFKEAVKQVTAELLEEGEEAPEYTDADEDETPSLEEQLKIELKKARSYAEYLQRTIDDLNRLKRNKSLHSELIESCGKILQGLQQW